LSKLDLRSFQQEISERLVAARRAGGEPPRLAFSAGGVRYALPLADVSEVAPFSNVRDLPASHPWFMGVINIRGSVMALTHLGALIKGVPAVTSASSRVLVLGGQFARMRSGLLVDSVFGLRAIRSTQPLPTADVSAVSVGEDINHEHWVLLDVTRLVSATDFFDVTTHAQVRAA
jgi:twitching motility protein PilI